jgi:hypothetical protein
MMLQVPFKIGFHGQELTPFEKYPFLKQEDWDQFVENTTSKEF